MENTQYAQKQRDSLEWLDDGEGARLAPDDKMTIKATKHDNGHVTTTSLTLLLDGCGNPTWSQIGANWPRHIMDGPLAPFGCPMALTPQPILMAIYGLHHLYALRPYPAVIGPLGQFTPHQPPGLHH
ncbi:hypothetical protein O181_027359 [Austropuccinia psidii MF-1]|uniref:Uncharacterized protein n=1 Tax=Austropuccinia psidii MF-1 TaxID=1389203 RepID=A0A9Q3H2J3_9BASI|nr:hypothetical protein [Austropuccinia psidii MF-1]